MHSQLNKQGERWNVQTGHSKTDFSHVDVHFHFLILDISSLSR